MSSESVKQSSRRLFAELRYILAEIHRLHYVVSWQRERLERRKKVKKPKSVGKAIQRS